MQWLINVCNISLSQLSASCLKGDRLAITIYEEEYKLSLESCKYNLCGKILWQKGATPLTVAIVKSKLTSQWTSIGNWGITSLGKCFFGFTFSCLEDVQVVRSTISWNLNPGILKLFPWTKDFVPSNVKQTFVQVWVRIHGLPQEYWRPRIIFIVSSSLGTHIHIDYTSSKSAFDRYFGILLEYW